ncbi:MAG TPA: type VI secretion system protein TssA [Xanthomonadales bacterium]|nr:type VI secretion system protein TssA [Xanthomonadales bacterium]
MSSITTDFSQPISEESPSGENLEYETEYQEMVRLSEPQTRRDAPPSGDNRPPPQDPADWRTVEKLALGLLENTRDCRVVVHLALASLHTKGIETFRDCLELLNTYIGEFWGSVHPQLDEEDNDSTMRINAVETLNEYSYIVSSVAEMTLVDVKGLGKYSVHDIDLAEGNESPGDDDDVQDPGVIREAFLRSDPEQLQATLDAALASIDLLKKIDETWTEQSRGEQGPVFDLAEKSLRRVVTVMKEYMPSEELPPEGEGAEAGEGEVAVAAMTGAVRNRRDVVRVLDNICDYYSRHEPSSPIPLLLRRAQRLVEKSFMEILQDMVPDSVNQARIVSGDTEGQ